MPETKEDIIKIKKEDYNEMCKFKKKTFVPYTAPKPYSEYDFLRTLSDIRKRKEGK